MFVGMLHTLPACIHIYLGSMVTFHIQYFQVFCSRKEYQSIGALALYGQVIWTDILSSCSCCERKSEVPFPVQLKHQTIKQPPKAVNDTVPLHTMSLSPPFSGKSQLIHETRKYCQFPRQSRWLKGKQHKMLHDHHFMLSSFLF